MRIAQIISGLNERSGGPSVSVPKLAASLSELSQQVTLLTTDHAGPVEQNEGSMRAEVYRSSWPQFLAASAGLSKRMQTGEFDIIHHHGIWQRPLHYSHQNSRKTGCPLVISPRGMMTPWAWNHHSFRKNLALRFIHPDALAAAKGWHATSQQEADEIRSLGFEQPVCVAANGVELPSEAKLAASQAYWREVCPETTTRPTALFYSRFHRKKRVLELIDLWLTMPQKDWILLMVGIPQEYSVQQLRDYVLRSSGQGRIHIYDGVGAPAPYPAASLFVLPSHSENFGMVVAEALIHGLPVLVTDTTPWSQINATDFGWCGPWQAFGNALSSSLSLGTEVLRTRGQQAIPWAASEFSWSKTASTLCRFYEQLASK